MSAWRPAALAAAAGGIACLVLAVLSASGRLPAAVSITVAFAPLLAGAVALSWRSRARVPVLLAAVAALVAAAVHRQWLAQHVAAVWLLQHVTIHAALALYFGRSLLAGREPIVTRIARAVLPSMPPVVLQYSRRVTQAWTAYFLIVGGASPVVYLVGGSAVWLVYAAASGPLVALMFALEYAVRRRVVPASHRASIAQSVAGFRALMRAPVGSSRELHG